MYAQAISLFFITIPTVHWVRCMLSSKVFERARVQDEPPTMETVILLPMRNERKWCELKISEVLVEILPHPEVKIVIIDSDSKDDTATICQRILEDSKLDGSRWELVETEILGKSLAVNMAIEGFSADVMVMMDADTKSNDGWLSEIWSTFCDDEIAVVSGLEKHEGFGARMTYKNSSDKIRIVESGGDSTPIVEGGLIAWRGDYMQGFRLNANLNADDAQLALECIRRGFRSVVNPALTFEDRKSADSDYRRSIRRSQGLSRALTSNIDLILTAPRKGAGRSVGIAFSTYVLVPWSLLLFSVASPFVVNLSEIGASLSWGMMNCIFFIMLLSLPQGRAMIWGSMISLISHCQYMVGKNHAVWDPGLDSNNEGE